VVRDYDTSIPEFRGDHEQLIQAVAQHRPQRLPGACLSAWRQGDASADVSHPGARQTTFGKQRYRLALELHVIDNGPGVPDSIKDRIFYPLVSGAKGAPAWD
jgi:two-component system nitrogen regulation sensor histidine kinase GlnL